MERNYNSMIEILSQYYHLEISSRGCAYSNIGGYMFLFHNRPLDQYDVPDDRTLDFYVSVCACTSSGDRLPAHMEYALRTVEIVEYVREGYVGTARFFIDGLMETCLTIRRYVDGMVKFLAERGYGNCNENGKISATRLCFVDGTIHFYDSLQIKLQEAIEKQEEEAERQQKENVAKGAAMGLVVVFLFAIIQSLIFTYAGNVAASAGWIGAFIAVFLYYRTAGKYTWKGVAALGVGTIIIQMIMYFFAAAFDLYYALQTIGVDITYTQCLIRLVPIARGYGGWRILTSRFIYTLVFCIIGQVYVYALCFLITYFRDKRRMQKL